MIWNLDYIHEDGEIEYGEIPFKIDRSQAVGKSIKININKSVELGNRSIKVKSLIASPTSTVVKGQIQNILELGLDTIRDNRIRPENIEFKLIADGKEIEKLGSGMSTDNKGITFDTRFDGLPPDTKELQLELVSFSGDFDVDEKNGNTYISITTEDDTLLSRVYLEIDGERIGLEQTIPGDFKKEIVEDKPRILYTRTLEFKGIGEDLNLHIERIRYNKTYNKLIYESTNSY